MDHHFIGNQPRYEEPLPRRSVSNSALTVNGAGHYQDPDPRYRVMNDMHIVAPSLGWRTSALRSLPNIRTTRARTRNLSFSESVVVFSTNSSLESLPPTPPQTSKEASPERTSDFDQLTPTLDNICLTPTTPVTSAANWIPVENQPAVGYTFLHPYLALPKVPNFRLHLIESHKLWVDDQEYNRRASQFHSDSTPRIFFWPSAKEHVVEVRDRMIHRLKAGDEVECFGALSGRWQITDDVRRVHNMRFLSQADPQEWVYLRMERHIDRRFIYAKLPATYFHPLPASLKFRASIQKFGKALARSFRVRGAAPSIPILKPESFIPAAPFAV
ncbi:hypothetical protein R3P38DRAFT_2760208 [Favolaschia claudopus]|uniref:Uncharacterized protein n=1 Tax=Favolaschia claudopus TaxID=2862362 RepID=A0AAW0DZ73_9AGAR